MVRISSLAAMLRLLWNSTRGYRLRPWASPYLRWRIETYWGLPAGLVDGREFWRFTWQQRRQIAQFLRWAGEMGSWQRNESRR